MSLLARGVGLALAARVLLDLAPGLGWPVASAVGSALILAGLIGLVAHRRELPDWRPADVAAGAFALLLFVAAARGDDPLRWTALYATPVALYSAARMCDPGSGPRWAVALAAVAAVPLAWDGVALASGQPATFVLNGYPRLLGGYGDPHPHAVALALFASVGALLADAGSGPVRRYGAVVAALALAFLVLTWVRTAMLLVAVQLVVYHWLRGNRRALIALLVVAVGLLWALPGLADRFSDVAAVLTGQAPPGGWGAIGSHRVDIWDEIWSGFVQRGPSAVVFGLGTGGHLTLHHKGLEPHSEWLTLWIQGGLLWPLAWLAWLALAARGAWRADRPFASHAASWAVAVFICAPLSNDVISRLTLVGWVFAALGVSQDEPRSEGGGEGDREVVVDAAGQQLGRGAEDRGDEGGARR